MATAVPFQSEDSILCWELESTRGTAAAASGWRSFGRVTEWTDLGPEHAIFSEPVAGAGREAHAVGAEGKAYRGTIGPFQVVDPLIIASGWGQEVSAPAALGGGYYRHTATPTTNGRLPSYSVHMRDRTLLTTAPLADKNTFLETVSNRVSIKGEAVGDDGSGGRCMAALDVLAHNDDPTVADKTVTLPTTDPYRFHHGAIVLHGTTVARMLDWEFTMDNQAKPAYYWGGGRGPSESPPDATSYALQANIIADGDSYTTGAVSGDIKTILRGITAANATISMTRTTNQDEFDLNLTDVIWQAAPKGRSKGRVIYACRGVVRASTMTWVDTTSTRFYPS